MKNSTNKKLQLNLFIKPNEKLLMKIKNWEKENREAIDLYNQRIAQNGLFSDGLRSF